MIRVLIADDSLMTRMVIKDLLARDSEIAVIGEARDGRQAVEETCRLKPDLVIMDIIMPVMDGMEAVKEIMAHCPVPILVLSANVDPKDSRNAFNAIQHGALDVMEKPRGVVCEVFEEIAALLIEKVKMLSRVRVMHHFRGLKPYAPPVVLSPPVNGQRDILAIGASTGGPKAVKQIMSGLSPESGARVLIVQHIADGFADGFASWLDREVSFDVRLAKNGDSLKEGVALVAPNRLHMTIKEGQVVLSAAPPVNCCRPSVDVLFNALAADNLGRRVVAVLLTGMGHDGARGMDALKKNGAYTIAQNEETSALFGMPKAAIDLGAVHQTLPLEQISKVALQLLQKTSE